MNPEEGFQAAKRPCEALEKGYKDIAMKRRILKHLRVT